MTDKPIGILSPVFDWTEEQKAEAEPSNIIDLAAYRWKKENEESE